MVMQRVPWLRRLPAGNYPRSGAKTPSWTGSTGKPRAPSIQVFHATTREPERSGPSPNAVARGSSIGNKVRRQAVVGCSVTRVGARVPSDEVLDQSNPEYRNKNFRAFTFASRKPVLTHDTAPAVWRKLKKLSRVQFLALTFVFALQEKFDGIFWV